MKPLPCSSAFMGNQKRMREWTKALMQWPQKTYGKTDRGSQELPTTLDLCVTQQMPHCEGCWQRVAQLQKQHIILGVKKTKQNHFLIFTHKWLDYLQILLLSTKTYVYIPTYIEQYTIYPHQKNELWTVFFRVLRKTTKSFNHPEKGH